MEQWIVTANRVLASKQFKNFEHIATVATCIYIFKQLWTKGIKKSFGDLFSVLLKSLPATLTDKINSELEKEAEKNVSEMFSKESFGARDFDTSLEGDSDKIMDELKRLQKMDANAEDGTLFAYAYHHEDHKFQELLHKSFGLFMHSNALNAVAFPCLKRFENEVVAIVAKLMHGDEQVRGHITTGGTESLLMAVKTYRDRARALKGITEPEMILSITAHAAFEKAAHYFGVKTVYIPTDSEMKVDLKLMRKAINKNTILLVGSAPQYPHGIVDPIEEIGKLAEENNLPLHVDACIGGMILPFIKKLGYDLPNFDFLVPQVTSISIDIHKYGYGIKGTSVILYRNATLRKYQLFAYANWPGGLFVSPSMTGTRGGGNIAASWAALQYLGEPGYLKATQQIMETCAYLKKNIAEIKGLHIIGKPQGSILSFTSDSSDLNIFAVGDVMEKKHHWHIERQQFPNCIHLTIMPPHFKIKEKFVTDLIDSVEVVKNSPKSSSEGSAAMYGLLAKVPTSGLIEDFLVAFMGKVYSP